jgi:hypothetical protein
VRIPSGRRPKSSESDELRDGIVRRLFIKRDAHINRQSGSDAAFLAAFLESDFLAGVCVDAFALGFFRLAERSIASSIARPSACSETPLLTALLTAFSTFLTALSFAFVVAIGRFLEDVERSVNNYELYTGVFL